MGWIVYFLEIGAVFLRKGYRRMTGRRRRMIEILFVYFYDVPSKFILSYGEVFHARKSYFESG